MTIEIILKGILFQLKKMPKVFPPKITDLSAKLPLQTNLTSKANKENTFVKQSRIYTNIK